MEYPDTYEFKRGGNRSGWYLYRENQDPEFGFSKEIGWFPYKKDAKKAAKWIKAHEDMNFAEWFYPQMEFWDSDHLDHGETGERLYDIWRRIGGHLSVQSKWEVMSMYMRILKEALRSADEEIDGLRYDLAHSDYWN